MRRDSTQNIARRYRHLFRLPTLAQAIVYSSAPVLLFTGISRYVVGYSDLLSFLLYLIISEILFLISVAIDTLALMRASGSVKIASFRRLASIAVISNYAWFLLSLLGLGVFSASGGSAARYLSLIILGAFFAVELRAFVFGAIFYNKPIKGLPLAFVQPLLLFVPLVLGSTSFLSLLSSAQVTLGILGGLVAAFAVELYMMAINGTLKVRGFRPLELLQAFLDAWVVQDPQNMEQMLDIVSNERSVRSDILTVRSGDDMSAELIVPGIHPGPFYPIGSSNLPADIFRIRHSNLILPLTVHSISDHELNLPSKEEVAVYVSSFKNQKIVDEGNTMTTPLVRTRNKATVSGLAMGYSAVIAITQAPHGMEDFPVEVRNAILDHSSRLGFKETLVIDTHNSEGAKPNEEEANDAIEIAIQVLEDIKRSKQYPFRVAFSHSAELDTSIEEKDVGPAGIGLLLFDVGEDLTKFSLVIVDANNALIGFREKVIEDYEKKTNSKFLDLCTSDTHVTAARELSAKGYLALGDKISAEKFSSIVISLHEKANSRLREGSFTSAFVDSKVKTAGEELLDQFSGLLDSTIKVARRGAFVLGVIAVLTTIVVAAF